MTESNETRRKFIGAAVAGGAAVTLVGASRVVKGDEAHAHQRKVLRGKPTAPFSRAVGVGPITFVAGVVGRDPDSGKLTSADFEPQCRQAMENLKASVEAAGSSMDMALKCGCFLTDVRDFATFNKIFREYFPNNPPARSTVVVKELVVAGAKIEIDCVTSVV